MKKTPRSYRYIIPVLLLLVATGCATTRQYRDANMDFGLIQTVAVLPFLNLSRDNLAGERVRDVYMTSLLATGAMYVVPPGEVARAISRVGISNPMAPAPEEVVKFASNVKADVVFTGTVREYGEIRSGTSVANVISLNITMMEAQTGKVVWAASSTKGGIGVKERLFGGGGEPLDKVTEKAVDELIDNMFYEK